MIQAIDVINFLSYITIGIMYIFLIDLKYSMKKSLIAFSIFTVISYIIFFTLVYSDLLPSFVNTTFLAIPAAIFSIFLAKFKDSRFTFTLFTVDTFGLIVYFYARSLSIMLGNYSAIIVIFAIILYGISIHFIFKYRKVYITLQSKIKLNWLSLAVFSIFAYLMLAVLISYPTSIAERVEDLPSIALVSAFIAIAYIIVYKVFAKEVEIFNEKEEKRQLEIDNKNQKSRLEVQDVYYRYAYEDDITGLKNRRAFEEMKLEKPQEQTICMTLDINNLKELNDQHGHHEGDLALKILARALRRTFMDHDDIYRTGGDEFVVILNDYKMSDLKSLIKELNQELEHCCKEHNCDVSVAIGCSSYENDQVETLEDLIRLADKRMYQDKARYKLS